MTVTKRSQDVTVVRLLPDADPAKELEEILDSSGGGDTGHILINLAAFDGIPKNLVLEIVKLHSAACLRGRKLVLFSASSRTRQAFAQLGLSGRLDFASNEQTALSWAGAMQ